MPMMDFVEIARLFERKQSEAAAAMAVTSEAIAEGTMAYAGPQSYANRASGFGLGRAVTDAELDRLMVFYASRGENACVEIAPFVPEELLMRLGKRGFVVTSFENVLVRELTQIPPMPVVEGLHIERVAPENEEALRGYVRVAASGFLPEGVEMNESWMTTGLRFARLPSADSFMATINGMLAGAAGCESSGGMSSLFGTTVLPAFRRRGVQQALMITRMRNALARGCKWVSVCAGPGIPTERNASRMGFVMAYSRAVMKTI